MNVQLKETLRKNGLHVERDLKTTMETYRLNSLEGEITRENYLRINNTQLDAEVVARMIKEKFLL